MIHSRHSVELRIEAATLTERAARVDELRAVLKTIQEQQGRAEDTGKTRSAPKRRTKPEGKGRGVAAERRPDQHSREKGSQSHLY